MKRMNTSPGFLPVENQEFLVNILDAIPELIQILSPDFTIIHCNKAFYNFFGIKEQDIKGKKCYELFGWEKRCSDCPVSKALESGQPIGVEKHLPKPDLYFHCYNVPIKNKKGQIQYIIRRIQDITRYKKAEVNLKESEKTFKNIIEKTPVGVCITNEEGFFELVNAAYCSLYGYSSEELIGRHFTMVVPKEDKAALSKLHDDFIQGAYEPFGEWEVLNKQNEKMVILANAARIKGSDGRTKKATFVIDITERKKMEEKIMYLSYHDRATGLYNRAYFEDKLEKLNSQNNYMPLSIIVADVNGLKLVNDAFGHQKGDELLREIAGILKKCCPETGAIARWGGDEFAVLLPRAPENAADKICKTIKKLCIKNKDAPIPLSVALGSATKKNEKEDINRIIRLAEDRMYRNKLLESKSARNSIISFLKKILFEKTSETEEHAQRLQELARQVGKKLKLSESQLDSLVLLAGLHDIGKIAVDESILNKQGKLTPAEWEIIKKHPEIGYRIANSTPELSYIAEGILAHHERWDGKGYPRGLKGEEIPLISRIVAIIDAYDVMVHGRPYKNKMTKPEAVKELIRCSGSQFDPKLLDVFIQVISGKKM